MYYLTIEVMEGGVLKQYDAKVWVKPWEGYKELESFLPSASTHYDPAVDVSAKLDPYGHQHEYNTRFSTAYQFGSLSQVTFHRLPVRTSTWAVEQPLSNLVRN